MAIHPQGQPMPVVRQRVATVLLLSFTLCGFCSASSPAINGRPQGAPSQLSEHRAPVGDAVKRQRTGIEGMDIIRRELRGSHVQSFDPKAAWQFMKTPLNRPSPFNNQSGFNLQAGEDTKLEYSVDGSLLLHTDGASAHVYDASSSHLLLSVTGPAADMVQGAAVSPMGTYLIICSRWQPGRTEGKSWRVQSATGVADTAVHGNLHVWHVQSGKLMADWEAGWPYDVNRWPYLQWASDETLMARYMESTYELYDLFEGHDPPWSSVRSVPVSGHSVLKLAPKITPPKEEGARSGVFIGLFSDESDGQSLSLLSYPDKIDLARPIRKTPVSNTEDVSIRWAYDGSAFLALCTAHVDETNTNYYGTTTLYFISTLDLDSHEVALDKDGPVHDFAWSPCTREFIVVYGVMPAKACLFNHVGQPVFSYGSGPMNSISWAPHGRFVCLGGFGNLAGKIVFWDKVEQKKLGEATARCAIYKEFSPCSRFFLTAVTYPSLRVDNEISLWRYDGSLVYREQHIPELYQCQWRPALPAHFPDRSASPDVQKRVEALAVGAGPRGVTLDDAEQQGAFVPFRKATFGLHDNVDAEKAGAVDADEWGTRTGAPSKSRTVGVQVEGMPFGTTRPTLSKSQLKRMKRKAKDKAKREQEQEAGKQA